MNEIGGVTRTMHADKEEPDHVPLVRRVETALEESWQRGYAAAVEERNESQANLGLATTRELLEEIKARGEAEAAVGYYIEEPQSMAMGAQALLDSLPGSMLDYRTVDGR